MLSIRNLGREAVNTNLKVIGLIRLGIEPKSAALEAGALTTKPAELFYSTCGGYQGLGID